MSPLPFMQIGLFSYQLPLQRIKPVVPVVAVWKFPSLSVMFCGFSDRLKNLSVLTSMLQISLPVLHMFCP